MTADATTLRALIARLEAGEVMFDLEREISAIQYGEVIAKPPRYLTSIDTAVGFAELAMPGVRIAMAVGDSFSTAWIMRGWGVRTQYLSPAEESGNDEDLPRLIVLATLKAKLAEMEAVP